MQKSILEYNLMRKKVSNKNSFEIEVEEKLGRMMTAGVEVAKSIKNATVLLMKSWMNTGASAF